MGTARFSDGSPGERPPRRSSEATSESIMDLDKIRQEIDSIDDQILPGVTRESTIDVARKLLHMKVEERALPIEEVIAEGEELFCTGTAWTIQSVREIVYKDRTHEFPVEGARKALLEALRGIQTGAREDPFGWTREVEGAASKA